MRKILVIIVLLLLNNISTSQAQIIRGYGLKVGATISNQNWEYSPSANINFNPDNRTGLNVGLFAELLNIPFISIVTEINYMQKGMKKDIIVTTASQPDGTGEFVTFNTRLDYINLSALGKLRMNFGIITPYLLIGPKVDFEIYKKSPFFNEELNKNRYGIRMGIGTEINLISFNLLAEVLYDTDFNDLYKNQNLEINSSSFDLRVGIMF